MRTEISLITAGLAYALVACSSPEDIAPNAQPLPSQTPLEPISVSSQEVSPTLTPTLEEEFLSSEGPLRFPLIGECILSQGFNEIHSGVDLHQDEWSPIYGETGYKVVYSGWISYGGGFSVVLEKEIEPGKYLQILNFHMSQWVATEGEIIDSDRVLGYMGSTGKSTGPHLHYELNLSNLSLASQETEGMRKIMRFNPEEARADWFYGYTSRENYLKEAERVGFESIVLDPIKLFDQFPCVPRT